MLVVGVLQPLPAATIERASAHCCLFSLSLPFSLPAIFREELGEEEEEGGGGGRRREADLTFSSQSYRLRHLQPNAVTRREGSEIRFPTRAPTHARTHARQPECGLTINFCIRRAPSTYQTGHHKTTVGICAVCDDTAPPVYNGALYKHSQILGTHPSPKSCVWMTHTAGHSSAVNIWA